MGLGFRLCGGAGGLMQERGVPVLSMSKRPATKRLAGMARAYKYQQIYIDLML